MPADRPAPRQRSGPSYETAMTPRYPAARLLRLVVVWAGVLFGGLAFAASEEPKTPFDVAGGDLEDSGPLRWNYTDIRPI